MKSTELVPTETTRLVDSNSRNTQHCIEDQREIHPNDREGASRHRSVTCFNDSTKSVVFGGIDGLVASLAIIAAAEGAAQSWKITLALGAAVVIASAVAVGISEFLSSKAHREFLHAEKRRELWEFKHYRDGEISEMINRFEARGMQRKDAEIVVNKMAQYENFFVGLMVSEELGLQLPEEDNDSALLTDAFIMFFSFASFGMFPFLAYISTASEALSEDIVLYVALSIGLILLAILGVIKSSFCSSSWLFAALETVFLGVMSASVAFSIAAWAFRLLND